MEKQQAPHESRKEDIFYHVPSQEEQVAPLYPLPPVASTTPGAAPNLFRTCEFSWFDYNSWLERMGLLGDETFLPDHMEEYVELYSKHDQSFDLQTCCLMPFERDYVFKLVAIIVATLTKTPTSKVTPTLRALVNSSWKSLCRLGIKLPLLEKLVATSRKPTAFLDARRSVEVAERLWQASSDDLQQMRTVLVSKVEEVIKNSNDQRALDDVKRMSKLVSSKLKEVENDKKVFNEKKELELKLIDSSWCSFP